MVSLGPFISRGSFVLAIALVASLVVEQVYAQLGVGDIVLGRSVAIDDDRGAPGSVRVYDASAGTWSAGPGWQIGGTELDFIQGIEFDNANGYSHNARGNLLTANFGGGFTGFEIYNFATDGSSNAESVFRADSRITSVFRYRQGAT